MAKSTYTSAASTPIKVEFTDVYELEHLIEDLTDLLKISDRGYYSSASIMRDQLIEVRKQALEDLISSAQSRLEWKEISIPSSKHIDERKQAEGEAA